MRGWITMVLVVVMVGGCKRPPATLTNQKDDSVIMMERERIVERPAERIELLIPIECDSITNKPKPLPAYTRKSNSGSVQISVDSAGIRFTEDRKAYESRIKELQERISHREVERIEIPVPFTRKIDIVCRWIAGISALIVALIIVQKLYF